MSRNRILIIIPAFNEADNIVDVITSLKEENPSWDLLVINDASSDNTSELAKKAGMAAVLDLPCNLGVGGAVQAGFIYAVQNGYHIAVKFDGDGQHKASEIHKLLEPIQKGICDVVMGSRFCAQTNGFKSTFPRRIGIRIFRILNSILIHQKITDSTSGFRAYNQDALEFLSVFYPAFDYPEPEEIILLGRNKFKFIEISTEMEERKGGQSSIYGYKSIYYMIKVLLSMFMVWLRPPKRS